MGIAAVAAVALVLQVLGAPAGEEQVHADRLDAPGVTSTNAVVPERIAWSVPGDRAAIVFPGQAVPVAVIGEVLVIESHGTVRGVDLQTGATRYEVASYCCAEVDGDALTLLQGARAVTLDAATGQVRHEVSLDVLSGHLVSVSDGVAVIVQPDGTVTGVEVASGQRRWQRPGEDDAQLLPMSDGDLLTTEGGAYVRLDGRTGETTPLGFEKEPLSFLLHASREVLVELRAGDRGSEPVVLDLVSGRSIEVRDVGPEHWHSRPAAVGVTDDEVTLHLIGPGAVRIVISRETGTAREEQASRVNETVPVSRPNRPDTGLVLWRTDGGAVVVDAATMRRRVIRGVEARRVFAVGGHVVLAHERPSPERRDVPPWHVIDEQGRRVAEIQLRDLPPPPPSWQGRQFRVLQRPDGTILDPDNTTTRVRGRIDGATVGNRPSNVVAATAAGDLSVTAASIALHGEDEVHWSISPHRGPNQQPVPTSVLNEHVVVLQAPSLRGFVGSPDPPTETPATVTSYRLADGERVDVLELPLTDPAPHELAVRDGTLWLIGSRLARVDVADDGQLTLRWNVEPRVAHVGNVDVAGGLVWSVTPWALLRWDAATGRELDPVLLPVAVDESGVLHDGRLFAVSGRSLVGIDAGSGQLAWQVDLPTWPSSQVAVAGDRAYVGLDDGTLVTVTTDRGEERHEISAGDRAILGRPLVARGQVLVVVASDPTAGRGTSHLVALVAVER